MRSDLALDHFEDGVRLAFARGNEDNLFRPHDVSDAHCQRIFRHLFVLEILAVGANCALSELDLERTVGKAVSRFVEADVSVCSDSEKLNVYSKPAFLNRFSFIK